MNNKHILGDSTAVPQLETLMQFMEVTELEDLENKQVRIVVFNGWLHGVGHPEKDEFIVISMNHLHHGEFPINVNEEEFSKILNYWN